VVFEPRFSGEGISQILDMHFQTVLTSEHVADFGGVLFTELRGSWQKKWR